MSSRNPGRSKRTVEDRVKKHRKGQVWPCDQDGPKTQSNEEYIKVIQITGLGLALIGGLGFSYT